MLFTGLGGLGLYSRPRAQFFPIQTSRPVNNIYLFPVSGMEVLPSPQDKKELNQKTHENLVSLATIFWAL